MCISISYLLTAAGGLHQVFTVLANISMASKMKWIRFQLVRSDGGFTLIEILIVVIIIAILAAITTLSVQKITITNAQKACQADWRALNAAASAFADDVGTESTNIQNLISGGYYEIPAGSTFTSPSTVVRSRYSLALASGVITVSSSRSSSSLLLGKPDSRGNLTSNPCSIVK